MPILQHLHLPNLTPYAHASRLQEILVSRLLHYKASLSKSPSCSQPPQLQPPPPPTILTFTPHPIYTTGRRETAPPSPSQLEYLKRPLRTEYGLQVAEFEQALRGGQITFHGPGQLVIYPIISLARPYSFFPSSFSSSSLSLPSPASSTSTTSPLSPVSSPSSTSFCTSSAASKRPSLSPRCYVSLLETTTINTLAHYGLHGIRTENPGVWIDEETKIAALGVHLRRNVTSHGVGLNVGTDLRWFGRIVACGLEGKGVTSMVEEVGERKEGEWRRELNVEEVAGIWVDAFARECGLGEEDVVKVTEKDISAEGDREGG